MLYAIISIILVLLVFLVVTYFITCKNYSFEIENHKITVKNRGAHLKIFLDDKIVEDHYMPQLIKGEEYKLQIEDKELVIKIRSSSLGYKMRVEIIVDENIVADNGIILKNREKKSKNFNESEDDDILNSKVTLSSDEKSQD